MARGWCNTMKRLKLLAVLMISLFIFTSAASATSTCEYTELAEITEEASKVKLTYEEVFKKYEKGTGDSDFGSDYDIVIPYFKVKILNVTDNLYIKVINSADGSTKMFSSANAIDNVITFDWTDLNTIANLTIKVYTSNQTNCANEEVLTTYQVLPKYNSYSTNEVCKDNSSNKACQKYVTEEISESQFEKLTTKAKEEKVELLEKNTETTSEKVVNFVKDNKGIIIIVISIIIVAGVVTTTVVIKKRRSRLI